jgi:type IV pilus assembly protein PilW
MKSVLSHERPAHRQSGFTMVELMIALLIGLFLMGGLIGLMQSNKRAFSSQNLLSQLQDSERLAMTMLNDVIEQAGYFPDPTLNTASSTLSASGSWTLGQFITGIAGAAPPGDTISVRYTTANGDGILNCTGGSNTTGANATYINTFSVITTGGVSQLVCTLNGTQYPLVNNVANLSVLYGVNTSGSGNNVDTYMSTAQVVAATAWSKVISAQVTLTFTNPLVNVPGQPPTAGQPTTFQIKRNISLMSQTG